MGIFSRRGNLEERYAYDAFGRLTERRFDGENRLGYNGKRMDPYSGRYDYGYRDYDPMVMRWTTVDPVKDGVNWYSYVGNDPVNRIDPLGLVDVESSDLIDRTSTIDRNNGTYEENIFDPVSDTIITKSNTLVSTGDNPIGSVINGYNGFMEEHASITVRAGGGSAGHLSTSDVKNNIGAGVFIGSGASITIDLTFDISDKIIIESDKIDYMIGGSGNVYGPISVGGEFIATEEGSFISLSIGLSIGLPGEGHFIVSDELKTQKCNE